MPRIQSRVALAMIAYAGMTKVYIYKLTVDDGGAPCVRDSILSLAICKPAIRSTAKRGHIILGFAANSLHEDNRLIYAARVTKNLDGRKYFSESSRYGDRPDCVYRWDGHRFEWRTDSKFHSPSDMEHDLGEEPRYNRAHVLLSEGIDNFRYFGDACKIRYKKSYRQLATLVENLGQGHRVNSGTELKKELSQVLDRLWAMRWKYRQTPIPRKACPDKCHAGDDDFAGRRLPNLLTTEPIYSCRLDSVDVVGLATQVHRPRHRASKPVLCI